MIFLRHFAIKFIKKPIKICVACKGRAAAIVAFDDATSLQNALLKANNLLDILPNTDSPMADKVLVMESLREEIKNALQVLNERERNIIKAFFGIDEPEMTLEEIGTRFGLTRERVRQIKEKAIRRLRHNTKSKMLKSFLGQ